MTTSQYERMIYSLLLACEGFSGGAELGPAVAVEAEASFAALGGISDRESRHGVGWDWSLELELEATLLSRGEAWHDARGHVIKMALTR